MPYLRSLLVMGARSVLAGLGDRIDQSLGQKPGRTTQLLESGGRHRRQNLRLAWAVLHYGDDFRRIEETA